MKIKLNGIEFEVTAVEGALREAILTDPVIVKAVWRDVYTWDAAAQEGKPTGPMTQTGAVPLANGISFYVAKGDTHAKNESASKTSGERFLKALDVRSSLDVLKAMARLLGMPQKTLPKEFDPLKPVASFTLKMHVEHSVLRLRNASRNLQAYVLVPGQVGFHHEITAISDQPGYDALIAEKPELKTLTPMFLVPARSKANREMRATALMAQTRELAAQAQGKSAEALPEALRMRIGRNQAELRMLAQAAQQARAPQAQPRRATA
ncbi:hypothetical protein [Limimaricola hongkongensis]|uniref:Uncharacterized protein n=1 Tax=Limimaricola hongkongensis DSM 17492 TaxID=1122180 RepID=A0A017HFG9_9RHOB|nr:hypothetical protein [Limimaricola hongkongensis]EYD73086.1 hypothetical protein Lokhon_00611 [Limimaricola hongkongensis DSM 17492]